VSYPSDRLLGWDAIRNGRIALVDDIRNDLRWQVVRERSYRTVIAVPLTKGGRAYGAISLDSEVAYAFAGRTAEIAIQLQPYIALLVLTYPADAVSTECAFDATHVWAQAARR
jgi:putative methionine-R-sulfoxide reductase with GAF domain